MPILTVQGPKLEDPKVKRDYVRDLTAAAATAYGMPAETIIIVFQDTVPDDVACGGVLIADRKTL